MHESWRHPGRGDADREARRPSASWVPTTDIFARGEDVVIRCELAGVDRGDVELSFAAGTLVVWGERTEAPDQDGDVEYYVRERRYRAVQPDHQLPRGHRHEPHRGDASRTGCSRSPSAAPPPARRSRRSRSATATRGRARRGPPGRATGRGAIVMSALEAHRTGARARRPGARRGERVRERRRRDRRLAAAGPRPQRHPGHEELRRAVRPRRAVQAGARRPRLQGHAEAEHRQHRGHRRLAAARRDRRLPGVPRRRRDRARAQGRRRQERAADLRHRPRLLRLARPGAQPADARSRTSTRSRPRCSSPSATACSR